MSGGNRRFPRTSRPVNSPPPPPPQNLYQQPTATGQANDEQQNAYSPLPKHIPFPEVPNNSEVLNELTMFVYTVIAAATQFLHLYRTVWWLSDSYTHQAINLYLIDSYLAAFIVILLGRRFVYCIMNKCIDWLCPNKAQKTTRNVVRIVYFHVLMIILASCCVQIFQRQSYMYIFCLCYPLILYVIIFGFQIEPFLRTTYNSETAYLNGIPLHCCSTNPHRVRDEIDMLKTDFNIRFKQVIFTSAINAYYAGFIPCCFAQNYLYYDIYWVTQHLAFMWLGGFTMCALYCFPAKYCDVLHRAALHLGKWQRTENRSHAPPALAWSKMMVWPPGALVKFAGDFYRAGGLITVAIPANTSHSRFYTIFRNPSILYLVLTIVQVTLVVVQLVVLLFAVEWHNTLSLSFLLLANHYTMFKVVRDYLVTQKVYAAEASIFEKLSNGAVVN